MAQDMTKCIAACLSPIRLTGYIRKEVRGAGLFLPIAYRGGCKEGAVRSCLSQAVEMERF